MSTNMNEHQAAGYLTLSVSYLRNNRSKNRKDSDPSIPFVKVGGRVVYQKADLDIFMENLKGATNENSSE